ncbi:MAG: divalent-cation tolerance protein CutA [Deltaproteobacteria bacterium]|nr:divalent-cation tolerance protein CutA [Deltaproteobacteria bacterium]
MDTGHIIVFVTVPDRDAGAAIGRKMVEERLAACCNIVPGLRSIYRWKGKICDEAEALCIFKTRSDLFGELRDRVKSLHPYECPEIIAVDIKDGFKGYLDWIDGATGR